MSTFKLPLESVPQTFQITLNGKDYSLTCKWNDAPEAGWVFDIADSLTGDPIVANLPITTGINILAGLEYLGFGGQFICFTDGNDFSVPTLDNLGVESNVYFVTDS